MFRLSDDERIELRDVARRMLIDRSSTGRVRELLDDPDGFDPALWSSMADLGWLAIHVPEADGGMGASHADLAVVLHELGRQITPSPVLWSAVVGAAALGASENTELAGEVLPGVVSGDLVVTVALGSASGSYEASELSVRCEPARGGLALSGSTRFVPDAHVADHLVVAARGGDGGVSLGLVDRAAAGVAVEVEPSFDQTRRLATVTFDDVVVDADRLIAAPETGERLHDRLVSIGAIVVVCDALGAAEHVLEVANEYAKERFQFNRPIGSFQAVKHHLVNMFTDVEAARAAVAIGVDALDAGDDLRHAAAIASSFAGPACARVAQLAIQVFGGIGFTWEHDAHLFLKRIRLDEALFGSARWHRQRLATMLLDDRKPI